MDRQIHSQFLRWIQTTIWFWEIAEKISVGKKCSLYKCLKNDFDWNYVAQIVILNRSQNYSCENWSKIAELVEGADDTGFHTKCTSMATSSESINESHALLVSSVLKAEVALEGHLSNNSRSATIRDYIWKLFMYNWFIDNN